MVKEEVLRALGNREVPLSGEELSRRLGVSRAAVWKAVTALRSEGYTIEALPTRGYRLVGVPDLLRGDELSDPNRVVGCQVVCLKETDSTNDECKRRAMAGAPTGLAVTADVQTGGRGRRGRRFESPRGAGLYLSVLLRPDCAPAEAVTLTAWVGVAVCDAVEQAAGVRPLIKWTNDIILNGKKLCGILTEMSVEGETGAVDYVVAGMGTNVGETAEYFAQAGLADIATSLDIEGHAVDRNVLAACLLNALDRMAKEFPQEKGKWLKQYRADCLTPGHEVKLVGPEGERRAEALAIDDDFGLVAALPDGTLTTVTAGEVSVRGIAGYV